MRDIEADGAQLDAAPEVMCDAVNLTHLLTSVRAAGSAILKVKEQSVSARYKACLLYTSPSPRDKRQSRMPSSA